MEKTIDLAELQELKIQFGVLTEKLEKQQIINESLIKESMKRKVSYVERYYRLMGIMYVILSLALGSILLALHAHWAIISFVLIAMVIEMMMYYKGYRRLNPEELMVMGYIDAVERVSIFRKQYQLVTKIMIVPAIVAFVLCIMVFSGFVWDWGTIVYYSVFVAIALIWEITRKRKLFSRLDSVLKQIKELRDE